MVPHGQRSHSGNNIKINIMATEQKTYLINFEDNLAEYSQRAADAKREVDRLKQANEELRKSGTATADEIEQSNAALRVAQQEYKNATKNVDTATKALNAQSESYEQLYRQWQLAQTQLKLMPNAYTTNEKGIRILSDAYVEQSKKVDNAKKALDVFGKGIHDNRLNVANYTEGFQNALDKMDMMPGSIGRVSGGLKGLTKQFVAFLANPIVAFIAAIAAALVGLYKAFTSTDTGATKMAATFESIRAIMDVVRQRVVSLIGALSSLFKGDFKKAGEQLKQTFTGIGEQMRDAAKAGWEYKMTLDSIEDSQNNFISQAADMRNAIAQAEFTAADASRSLTERKKANAEALRLSEELTKTETENAKRRMDAEIKYLAEKNNLTADAVLGFVRMTDSEQQNASESLQIARNNNEAKFKEIEELYSKWRDADTKFYEENKRNIAKAAAFEEQLRKEQKEKREAARVEQLRRDAESSTTEMRTLLDKINTSGEDEIVAVSEREKQKDDVLEAAKQRRLERIKIETQSHEALLATSILGQLELERQKLEQQYQMEIAAAERVGADTTDIDARYAKARKTIAQAERDAKLEFARGIAQEIINATGESSAIGKAAAVALTTIDTFRSAQAAFTGMTTAIPGPVGIAAGIAAAAAAVAMGIANVKKILAVKLPKGSGGGGSSAAGGSAMSTAAQRVTAKPLGATTLQPIQSAADVQKQQQQSQLTADQIAGAVAKLPAPVVTVEDINQKTKEKTAVEVRANV
jgi:hypothetical protein